MSKLREQNREKLERDKKRLEDKRRLLDAEEAQKDALSHFHDANAAYFDGKLTDTELSNAHFALAAARLEKIRAEAVVKGVMVPAEPKTAVAMNPKVGEIIREGVEKIKAREMVDEDGDIVFGAGRMARTHGLKASDNPYSQEHNDEPEPGQEAAFNEWLRGYNSVPDVADDPRR